MFRTIRRKLIITVFLLCICAASSSWAAAGNTDIHFRETDSIIGSTEKKENKILKEGTEISEKAVSFASLPKRFVPGSYNDGTVLAGGTYVIENSGGLGSLNTEYSSTYEGANVYLSSACGTGSEKWVLQDAGRGYYFIRNLRSWKCLDITDGNVQQSEFDVYSDTQKWRLIKNKNGSYQVINANGMYLDAVWSGVWTDACAFSGTGKDAGSWIFKEVDPGTALDFRTDGTQHIGIRCFEIFRGNVVETDGYYNIKTSVDLPDENYEISGDKNYSIGIRTMYVNSFLAYYDYLPWDFYYYERYLSYTTWAVEQFQADHGLEPDGVVDLRTWTAMGFSYDEYYGLDRYVTPLKVRAYGSSREAYINAMLDTAYEYWAAYTEYLDGASGRPGTYVDCSGLIYQCLYAAGIDPDTNIADHTRVIYEYGSAYMGYDWKMGEAVSYAEPGDLIFYGSSWINHVAIYIGDGLVIDSAGGAGVSCHSVYSSGNILKIVRVF